MLGFLIELDTQKGEFVYILLERIEIISSIIK